MTKGKSAVKKHEAQPRAQEAVAVSKPTAAKKKQNVIKWRLVLPFGIFLSIASACWVLGYQLGQIASKTASLDSQVHVRDTTIRHEINRLRELITTLRRETREDIHDIRNEVANLRDDMREDTASNRAKIESLRDEMRAFVQKNISENR